MTKGKTCSIKYKKRAKWTDLDLADKSNNHSVLYIALKCFWKITFFYWNLDFVYAVECLGCISNPLGFIYAVYLNTHSVWLCAVVDRRAWRRSSGSHSLVCVSGKRKLEKQHLAFAQHCTSRHSFQNKRNCNHATPHIGHCHLETISLHFCFISPALGPVKN